MEILAIQGKADSRDILGYFKKKGKITSYVGILEENPSKWCYYINSDDNRINCIEKYKLKERYPNHKITILDNIPKENNYETWTY